MLSRSWVISHFLPAEISKLSSHLFYFFGHMPYKQTKWKKYFREPTKWKILIMEHFESLQAQEKQKQKNNFLIVSSSSLYSYLKKNCYQKD